MTKRTIGWTLTGAILGFVVVSMYACRSIPKGATAVTDFKSKDYLGKWYEIARLDYKFERNLSNTTAQYSLKENGKIRVENRGYHTKKEKWQSAVGKAKFAENPTIGALKVSFFGPFYAGYNIVAIDPNYQYALVMGSSTKYLWILSRSKTIPDDIKASYLAKAQAIGYHTNELIWVDQSKD